MLSRFKLLVLLILNTSIVMAQELQKKVNYTNQRMKEEFYVLKNNKEIRQGQFISTFKHSIYRRQLVELGQFQNNYKHGSWLSFYYLHSRNPLKSVGSFQKNRKFGYWIYFYPFLNDTLSTILPAQPETRKKAKYVGEDVLNHSFNIELDTSGVIIMCKGEYENDIKVGVWEYYSPSRRKVHDYNHSKDSLTFYLHEQDSSPYLFLGGLQRFNAIFNTIRTETDFKTSFINGECRHRISAPDKYTRVSCTGDGGFEKDINYILRQIPSEWIANSVDIKKDLFIITKYQTIFDEVTLSFVAAYSFGFKIE
jgi:antitoxin component YwqK of YwqJK toxin-antitoxin module